MKFCKKALALLIFSLLIINNTFADDSNSNQQNILTDAINTQITEKCGTSTTNCTSNLLNVIYAKRGSNLIWSQDGIITKKAADLYNILNKSYEDGLDPDNYNIPEITKILKDIKQIPQPHNDSKDDNKEDINTKYDVKELTKLDILLTDGFLRYVDNVHNGIIDTKKIFPHWKAKKPLVKPDVVLNKALSGSLKQTLNNIKPRYFGYNDLKEKLAEYRLILAHNPWKSVSHGGDLTIGDSGGRVKDIQNRLLISGELAKIVKYGKYDDSTAAAVTLFQENMGLLDNGITDSDTVDAMNVPVEKRIQQIELNMDVMRSFPDSFGNEYIFINIPGYSLNLYKNGNVDLSMDVAVGSSNHQSCILNSKTTYLVANPAWYVPRGIAESEIFPMLQNGTGDDYLKSHNIQSFKIVNGKTIGINTQKIDWKNMTIKQFKSYRFTQKPGAGNLLGKVKFIFQNPCEIYLHDSIESDVFDASERDLSHGCIRMGEPMKMTKYVLNDEGMSDDEIATLFKSKSNQSVQFKNPINIEIVYLTSLVNKYNFVQFRSDIYSLFTPYAESFPVAQPDKLDLPVLQKESQSK